MLLLIKAIKYIDNKGRKIKGQRECILGTRQNARGQCFVFCVSLDAAQTPFLSVPSVPLLAGDSRVHLVGSQNWGKS